RSSRCVRASTTPLLGPLHAGWRLYDRSRSVRRPGRLYRRGELRDTKATWAADEPVTRYRLRILLVCPSDEICRCRCDAGDHLRWRGQQDPFEVRTTLRLNVALRALLPPTYNQPLK